MVVRVHQCHKVKPEPTSTMPSLSSGAIPDRLMPAARAVTVEVDVQKYW